MNDRSICAGETITLSAIPSVNNGTYTWSTGETTETIDVSPTALQYYYLTYDIGGCGAYDSLFVTVSDPGTITVDDETICGVS